FEDFSKLQMKFIKDAFPGKGEGDVDWDAFLQATELFNNFDLTDLNLKDAVDKIRENYKNPQRGVVPTLRGGPDRSGAHARWFEFALICIELDIDKKFWEAMLPVLLEGTIITATILNGSLGEDGWPDGDKAKKM